MKKGSVTAEIADMVLKHTKTQAGHMQRHTQRHTQRHAQRHMQKHAKTIQISVREMVENTQRHLKHERLSVCKDSTDVIEKWL